MPIRLVDKIIGNPGVCVICNAKPTDDEGRVLPMIDTEIDIDWGGNLYICSDCVGIMAQLYGWVTPQKYDEVDQLRINSEEKVADLEEELQGANETIDTLTRAKKVLKKRREQREEAAA